MPRGDEKDEVERIGHDLRADDPGLVELLPEILFQTRVQIGLYDGVANTPPVLHSTVQIRDAQGQPIPYDQYFDVSMANIGSARGDRAAAIDFAQRIHTRFERDAPYFLLRAADCFKGVITEIETTGKLDREDAKDALDFHLTTLRLHLEEYLGLNKPTKRDRRSKWGRIELEQAMHRAALSLAKDQRTYANVAALMQKNEPARAPSSGEALRKLCKRLGVKTKLFKRGGKRTSKIKSV